MRKGAHLERGIPGNRREISILIVFAVFHPQQWRFQAIISIHDLGKEITLYTIQALVDGCLRVTLGRDYTTSLGTD